MHIFECWLIFLWRSMMTSWTVFKLELQSGRHCILFLPFLRQQGDYRANFVNRFRDLLRAVQYQFKIVVIEFRVLLSWLFWWVLWLMWYARCLTVWGAWYNCVYRIQLWCCSRGYRQQCGMHYRADGIVFCSWHFSRTILSQQGDY